MHEALREVERKLESGVVELPPEGQRSPSPEPVYDRNGVRLNTREIRYKEKLLDRKHRECACHRGYQLRQPHCSQQRAEPSGTPDGFQAVLGTHLTILSLSPGPNMCTAHSNRCEPLIGVCVYECVFVCVHVCVCLCVCATELIEDLIKEDPNYKPPADYRPRKFQARVRLPQVRHACKPCARVCGGRACAYAGVRARVCTQVRDSKCV